jgi:hypothetical protein
MHNSRDAGAGLSDALRAELQRQGYKGAAGAPDSAADAHALLQEFRRADSDSRDVGLSKAMARMLIAEIGKVRAAPALERIRSMIAGGGSYPRSAGGRPLSIPRVLAAAPRGGSIPNLLTSSPHDRGIAAIDAAVFGGVIE